MTIDIWFTSDTHYGHAATLEEDNCNRPFSSVDEMNEALIENWNKCVKKNDRIFHLGDFSLTTKDNAQKIFNKLNGQKHLVLGNHDKRRNRPSPSLSKGWHWVGDVYGLHVTKTEYIDLLHRPCRSWNRSNYGSGHLFGHAHGKAAPYKKSFDVGVDCWDYSPVHLDDVRMLLQRLEDGFFIESEIFYGPDWLK